MTTTNTGPLGVAFIGCGRVADWQARFFEKGIDGAAVKVACDHVETKAQRLAERLKCDWSSSYEQVLDRTDLQVVSIMTESGYHYEHAKKALEAGKHVIVEKPPCMFAEQVIELSNYASTRGLMYAPIFQNRFNPAMQALQNAARADRFGKLVCASVRLFWCRYQDYYEDGWHGSWQLDGGVLNQQAIHHVDAMQWICGPVREVVALQGNRLNRLEAEDTTVALVRFENGALGTIEATTAARPRDMDASLTVIAEKGSASIGGIALNKITQWEFTDPEPGDDQIPERCSVEVENGYGYSHGPLIQTVIDRIRSQNLAPPVEPSSTADTVRLIHSLYRSFEDGGLVVVGNNLRSKQLGSDPKITLRK